MLSLSTLKMKFYQISSSISGSTGWHWTEEITDRLALSMLKNGKSVVRRCDKFYGKRFASDS